jgi:MarR family transcriptional regulator for hemolysin
MIEKNLHNPLRLIGRANRAFARVVEGPLRELGFAMSQVPVLVTLKKAGALSQAELARLSGVEQSSMAQLLNRMERDGLVERVADPSDRRSRLISLTDAAIQQLPLGKSVMDAVSRQALTGFSKEEKEQLALLLLRVNVNLDSAIPAVDG